MPVAAIPAIVGAAASVGGAALSSNAQKKAADKTAQAQLEVNRQNIEFAKQMGALPFIWRGMETKLGDIAMDYIGAGGRTGEEAFRAYQPYARQGAEMLNRGVNEILSDTNLNQRLAALQPVLQARENLARQNALAAMDALRKRTAALRAGAAAKGFTGGSAVESRALTGLEMGARAEAARQLADAELANAAAEQAVRDAAIQQRIDTLLKGGNIAQLLATLEMLPYTAMGQEFLARSGPAAFFKGNVPVPQLQAPHYESAMPVGAAILGGVSQLANRATDYLLIKDMLGRLQSTSPYLASPAGPAYGPSSIIPGAPWGAVPWYYGQWGS